MCLRVVVYEPLFFWKSREKWEGKREGFTSRSSASGFRWPSSPPSLGPILSAMLNYTTFVGILTTYFLGTNHVWSVRQLRDVVCVLCCPRRGSRFLTFFFFLEEKKKNFFVLQSLFIASSSYFILPAFFNSSR